jgi:hypothetical protein
MDVKKIPLVSGILLILSTLLFVISILIPDFVAQVPSVYVLKQIVLPISGGLILLFTYVFAIMSYSRELFTVNPQRIAMAYKEETGTSILTIRPYIVDKMEIHFYIINLEIAVSHNYNIAEIRMNGVSLPRHELNQDNECSYDINKNADTDLTIIVKLTDNGNETEDRFLRFKISYKKGKKWFNINYEETHKVL